MALKPEIRLLPCHALQMITMVESPYATFSDLSLEISLNELFGPRKLRRKFRLEKTGAVTILTSTIHARVPHSVESAKQVLGRIVIHSRGRIVGMQDLPKFRVVSAFDEADQILGVHVSILTTGISVRYRMISEP